MLSADFHNDIPQRPGCQVPASWVNSCPLARHTA